MWPYYRLLCVSDSMLECVCVSMTIDHQSQRSSKTLSFFVSDIRERNFEQKKTREPNDTNQP